MKQSIGESFSPILAEIEGALPKTEQIKNWLFSDKSKNWKQLNNPNCFLSNSLEIIYVYDNCIRYWEDLRAWNAVEIVAIPSTREKLMNILTNYT